MNRIPSRHLHLLDELNTEAVPHSGRTFREHLAGTWRLLSEWNLPESVRSAGLCHALYGTKQFRLALIGDADRRRVASVIGARAERLVYLFSVIDRPQALGSPCLVKARVTLAASGLCPPTVSVTPRTYGHLIAIEIANLLEQRSGLFFLPTLFSLLQSSGNAVPDSSQALIHQSLAAAGAAV